MKNRILSVLIILCLLLSGCGQVTQDEEKDTMKVYFLNNTETGVEMHDFEVNSTDAEGQLEELLELLKQNPDKMDYKAPLSYGFEIKSGSIEGDKVYLDVSEDYRSMAPTREILVRAALVRTLTGIEGIRYLSITVEGEQLQDSLGNLVGLMSADQFIDNAGTEINAYEKARLKLYFASEDGTTLVAVNRTVAYNTNISLEKLVVEQLLAGPSADIAEEAFPTINPTTKIISVSVKDGICYVNFDEGFLTQTYNISSDVAIYSLVNSLVELPNVNKVQITINGQTDVMYRESISLLTVFERNLNLLTKTE